MLSPTHVDASRERETNREVDELADGVTHRSDPTQRIPIDARTVRWDVLEEALEMGRAAERDTVRASAEGEQHGREFRNKRREQQERVRV